ncbi:hypothetical protein OB905_03510 [Halobacteria archaeon AArc-dxtr1]|nr:hypothetical protein [Halobacteria archaeon AArc-dxtr1]
MVGLSGRTSRENETPFEETLEALLHTDRYESDVAFTSEAYDIGTTAYPEYPTASYESDDYWLFLEGRIYDEPERTRKRDLLAVAETVFDGDTDSVADWVTRTDGEFLLAAVEKSSGRLALLNDALGRLPTYYYADGDSVLFSRELRYLVTSLETEFDRLGAAQCLLLGYSLGERTLLEGVKRLRPATLLVVDDEEGLVTEQMVHSYDFETNVHADRSRERNAAELVSLFDRACRTRANPDGQDVVSLSGGLDSRAVLAGYRREGLAPTAATMESPQYVPESDVEIAEEIAAACETEWQTYQISHPLGSDLETLVKTKNGQIGLLTSFILSFFRQLQDEYGREMAYVTGDGGDKVLPDLTPPGSVSESNLVDHVVRENSISPIKEVSELTDVPESEIRASIRDRLDEYPEDDPASAYVHYLVYERGVNYLFEGEDRNRFFFWSTTPFYSLPFFTYAMNCPAEQKVRYNLYRSFLTQLSPDVAEIPHPDYRAPVTSWRHEAAGFVDDTLSRYPRLMEAVKPIIKSVNNLDTDSSMQPDTIRCIRHQMDQCDAVGDVFSTADVHRFLDTRAENQRASVYRIFALTSFIDDVNSSQPVLETNRNRTFT